MAASGYTPILIYSSATTTNVPLAANLSQGELAINTADGKLFYKDSGGVVQTIATKNTASGVFTSITDSGLTSGRVTFAGTGGLLSDSANLTFNGTSLTLANDASISGLTVGKGGGAVAGNTVLGISALGANTTGGSNTAIGINSLYTNTTGGGNSALGAGSLQLNSTGGNNTAIGYWALLNNTTASHNTALGYQSLYSNTTGGAHTAVGENSLRSNTTGIENTAHGYSALYSNTTGNYNTSVGKESLANNTTASNNTAVGYQAGYSNTTGFQNFFAGQQAGYGTTTGAQNTALGAQALVVNTVASYNTAIGYQSLYSSNRTSDTNGYNTALGMNSGYGLTTGQSNTFLGSYSGYSITTGSKNTIVGQYNGNQGGLDIRTASNYIVLSDGDGNPRQVIDSSGNVGIGTSSPSTKLYVSGTGSLATFGGNSSSNVVPDIQIVRSSSGTGIQTGPNITFSDSTTNNTCTIQNSQGNLTFWNYGSSAWNERMRLDSSGNLGLGVTPSAWSGGKAIEVNNQGNALSAFAANDIRLGNNWYFNGTNYIYSNTNYASYFQQVNGQHRFYIAPSGTAGTTATFTQAMTLDASGNLGIGTTSVRGKFNNIASSLQGSGYNAFFQNTWSGDVSTAALYVAKFDNNSTTSQQFVRFSINNDATGSGQINANGASAAAFGSFSDKRLKENITDLPSQLNNIMALRPVEFDYIASEGGGHQIGFIAQEVKEIYPDLIGEREDGMFTLTDMNKNDARLIKCIQELKAIVDTQAEQIKALQGAK